MRPGDTLEATRMRVYGKPAAPFLSGILARLSFFRGHCLAFMPRSTWKSQIIQEFWSISLTSPPLSHRQRSSR